MRIIRSISSASINITLVEGKGLGQLLESGQYDQASCLGKIQRNDSDFHMPFVNFPLIAPGLRQGAVVLPNSAVIMSMYKKTFTAGNSSVLSDFLTLDDAVLAAAVLMLTFMTTLLTVCMLLSRSSCWTAVKQSIMCTLGALLRQLDVVTLSGTSHSLRLVHLCIILLTFYLLFYLSSMIKTEQVVQKEPDTISSYRDILKRNVTPIFLRQFSEYDDFAKSPVGSEERQVYDRAQEIGVNQTYVSMNEVNEGVAVMNLMSTLVPIQKAVVLVPSFLLDVSMTTCCASARALGQRLDYNGWIKHGNKDREKLAGFMIPSVMPTEMRGVFHRFCQRLFEGSIFSLMLHELNYLVPGAPDTGSASLRECESNQLILPDHGPIHQDLQHYAGAFLLLMGLQAVCAVVLLLECMIKRTTSRLRKVRLAFRWNKKNHVAPAP